MLVILTACEGKPEPPKPDAMALAEAQAGRTAAATPELEAAFTASFGEKPPATKVIDRDGEQVTYTYRPLKLLELNGRLVLISGGRVPGAGHAQVGVLAIDYLRRRSNGFENLGHWPQMAVGAGFGEPPEWALRDDLFPSPAIESRNGGTWQGCTVEDATFIELTPERPRVRARPILVAYDYSGGEARDAGGLRATVVVLEKGRSFAVDYAGVVRRRVIYQLAGGAYAPVGSQPDLPGC